MRLGIGIAVLAVVSTGAIAVAQMDHSGHGSDMDRDLHGQMAATDASVLREPGQGAFAALSEVVRVLEADPETDWSRVDLAGLRLHLVDMDRLDTHAVVSDEELPNGIVATATGDAETVATLRRMVPAHAAHLARDDRWAVTASETAESVVLQVTSEDPAVVARIHGLGFFGLMASQDHHRAHHLMMARGEEAHRH
ncbi:hypothetical protein [Yoonia sediminilitoris]|uniref:Uncharacterized protein n=1 Tax=Yoonia sediminilitoris TaxID=1286148 RepID=A0A2T6KBV2_9RHOB|nr:hypothetical protein [Yoonia sediminilitoris]PUB12363.1 hypothetical protein C8N45_1102 [Yoonia sediminilitoris]RCW93057.1 hypothetical protein DFP92_1102 [Yoonia sediminilitoris]